MIDRHIVAFEFLINIEVSHSLKWARLMRNIAIIIGHPDARVRHFCHALADAYEIGAKAAGHKVTRIDIGKMHYDYLNDQAEQEHYAVPAEIALAQSIIKDSDHLVFIYPLWLGSMPAKLKSFFEQIANSELAFYPQRRPMKGANLEGKSARVIITMGMPAIFYRFYYCRHSYLALKQGILNFFGIRPVRETLIGMVEDRHCNHERWLSRLEGMGRLAL